MASDNKGRRWEELLETGNGETSKHARAKLEKATQKAGRGGRRRQSMTRKACVLAVIVAGFFLFTSLRIVPPAHTAVIVTFGAVGTNVLQSGLHLLNPFAKVVPFNLKTQLLYSENLVPTKEGMNVELDISVLFRPDPSTIRQLYLSLGENYATVLLQPELQSAVRGLTSEQSAKALYTSGRAVIRDKLTSELEGKLGPRGIIIEDVLLKGIKLPSLLTDAIELKAQAEQEAARMEFVIAKEKQEADRKTIEAQGIASFQHIVSEGISPALLQWKGIEATELLAQSNNAKVVFVGNSDKSLPVLLSNSDQEVSGTGGEVDSVASPAP